MEFLILITIGIVLFCFFSYNTNTNYYQPKWYFFIQAIIVYLCYLVYTETGIFLALLFLYCMTSSNYVGMNIFNNHFALRIRKNNTFAVQMVKTLLCTFGLVVVLINADANFINLFITVSPYLLIIGSVRALFPRKWMLRKTVDKKTVPTYGYGANPSTSSTFLSLLAPISFFSIEVDMLYSASNIVPLLSLFLCLLALMRMKASAGLGGFIAALAVYSFYNFGWWTFLFGLILGVAIFLLDMAKIPSFHEQKLFKGKDGKINIFNSSGRDEIIKFSFDNFWRKETYLLGTGFGSYAFLMPSLQMARKKKLATGIFIWMHSDALQFLIEGGVVGAVLLLFAGSEIILYSHANAALMAFFASYLVNSLVNFPGHLAADSFVTMLMIKYAYTMV